MKRDKSCKGNKWKEWVDRCDREVIVQKRDDLRFSEQVIPSYVTWFSSAPARRSSRLDRAAL